MSLLLRRAHLYLALFLTPWILMYTVSTFVMNHRTLFHGPPPVPPPEFRLESEFRYPGEFPPDAKPAEIARQLLASLNLDGAHSVGRPGPDGKITIQRQLPVEPKRITYTPSNGIVRVETLPFSGAGFLERMHRRRGFQHDYPLEDAWAFTVDLTIAALVLLALSGIWMAWEIKVARWLAFAALAAGCALFALFLSVM